jgi:hypothetical protein
MTVATPGDTREPKASKGKTRRKRPLIHAGYLKKKKKEEEKKAWVENSEPRNLPPHLTPIHHEG